MGSERKIYVFADFLEYDNEFIGTIYSEGNRGHELYSFEYDNEWLKKADMFIDPDLQLYSGRQFTRDDKKIFGVFADSCPDIWGRLLMRRREEIRAKNAGEKPDKLLEADYLLGVYDESRMGGLRFKTSMDGDFVSSDKEFATPPWTSLRELEQASVAFENDEKRPDAKWLKQLIAPGSSLGGARPKASVLAPDGSLWIAKFPSKHDDHDSGAWEMVVHDLAVLCGLNVPETKLEKFSKLGSTFLIKRFDRDGERRIHFSSAMTLLGKKDGADSMDGSSYLEILSFIKANGVEPDKDSRELWKRIVFSMAVSNTDDHLRNHGFILTDRGWKLSPMFDVNPDIYGHFLSLNVDDENSRIDFDLALNAAKYYGLGESDAKQIISEISATVDTHWKRLAKEYGISRSEIERMTPAFE